MSGGRSAALDALPDPTVLLADGRIVAVNDLARRELGLGDDAVGREVVAALGLGGDDAAALEAALAAADPLSRVEIAPGGRPHLVAVRVDGDAAALTARPSTSSSDLIARLSHDIRSPLTSVKGFVRTLLSRWDRFSDDHRRTLLETIEVDADRVARLLTRLLEVARLDVGRTRAHPTPIDPGEVAEAVAARYRRAADDGPAITVEGGATPPALADRDKLELVLDELVDNAVRHGGGAAVRLVVAADTPGAVTIRVQDEGPGVAADMRGRLFLRLAHGDDRRAGTGLGLYLARGIARAQGGDVRWLGDEGPGTVVEVRLPTAVGSAAASASVQSGAGSRDGEAPAR